MRVVRLIVSESRGEEEEVEESQDGTAAQPGHDILPSAAVISARLEASTGSWWVLSLQPLLHVHLDVPSQGEERLLHVYTGLG